VAAYGTGVADLHRPDLPADDAAFQPTSDDLDLG
jgi:hypothetical protein